MGKIITFINHHPKIRYQSYKFFQSLVLKIIPHGVPHAHSLAKSPLCSLHPQRMHLAAQLYFIIPSRPVLDGITPSSACWQPSNTHTKQSLLPVFISVNRALCSLLTHRILLRNIKFTALLHLSSGHIRRQGLSSLSPVRKREVVQLFMILQSQE